MSPEPVFDLDDLCSEVADQRRSERRRDHVPQLEDRETVEKALHIRGHLTPLVRRRDIHCG
jgi:hypothetical protein